MLLQNLGIAYLSVLEHQIWLKYIKSLQRRNIVTDRKTGPSHYASALVLSKLLLLIFINNVVDQHERS